MFLKFDLRGLGRSGERRNLKILLMSEVAKIINTYLKVIYPYMEQVDTC